jgi:streptogramin lyase
VRLRKLSATATAVVAIATYAGAQSRRTSPKSVGDGGPAVKAQLNGPSSVAVDDNGHLSVYEAAADAIRKVDLAKGTITTLARGCDPPVQHPPPDGCFGPITQLQIDSGGKLLLSEFTYGRVSLLDPGTLRLSVIASYRTPRSDGDGGPATLARFSSPHCSTSDDKGNIYICAGYYIRRIDNKTGAISTVAGSGKRGFAGDHGPATAAEFGVPVSVAVDRAGDIFIADDASNRIRRVDATTGVIETIAGTGDILTGSLVLQEFSGDGGPATEARIVQPSSLAFDKNEDLLFVVEGRVCRIDRVTGTLSTIAGTGEGGFSGDGGPATKARIGPGAIAANRQGNLFIAEFDNNRVRRVDAKTGIITTVAGNGLPHRPPQGFN